MKNYKVKKYLNIFGKPISTNKIVKKVCSNAKEEETGEWVSLYKYKKIILSNYISGIIIGGKILKESEFYFHNSLDWSGESIGGGWESRIKREIFVLEIKTGFTNKSLFVRPEDILIIECKTIPFQLPYLSHDRTGRYDGYEEI